jgi:hypothetical protein
MMENPYRVMVMSPPSAGGFGRQEIIKTASRQAMMKNLTLPGVVFFLRSWISSSSLQSKSL